MLYNRKDMQKKGFVGKDNRPCFGYKYGKKNIKIKLINLTS